MGQKVDKFTVIEQGMVFSFFKMLDYVEIANSEHILHFSFQ